MSKQSFADLGVSRAVAQTLERRGFKAPFAIQEKVIGDVLDGRDVLAKSPTGSGKTLAFMVPMIDLIDAEAKRPAALVLAPTRELATQIVEETREIAHSRALKVTAVYGGVGLEKQAREASKSHIVVATPGRLEDFLDRKSFNLRNVQVLVLVESDRKLDMGFRPAVDRIVGQCPSDRQTLFFSATLDGEAGKIAKRYTSDAVTHEHVPPPERAPDIEHRFVRVEGDARVGALVGELGDRTDLSLVFVRTKRGADRLVKRLGNEGVKAAAMHGDKSQRQRERALAQFEEGRVTTLVATDVAARGIHVDGISKVINFDPPGQTEDYVHRVGRTGRAGERGIAVTFVAGEQVRDMRRMTNELRLEREFQGVAGSGNSTGLGDRPRRPAGESRNGNSRNGRPEGRNGRPDGRKGRSSHPEARTDRAGSGNGRSDRPTGGNGGRPADGGKPRRSRRPRPDRGRGGGGGASAAS